MSIHSSINRSHANSSLPQYFGLHCKVGKTVGLREPFGPCRLCFWKDFTSALSPQDGKMICGKDKERRRRPGHSQLLVTLCPLVSRVGMMDNPWMDGWMEGWVDDKLLLISWSNRQAENFWVSNHPRDSKYHPAHQYLMLFCSKLQHISLFF